MMLGQNSPSPSDSKGTNRSRRYADGEGGRRGRKMAFALDHRDIFELFFVNYVVYPASFLLTV